MPTRLPHQDETLHVEEPTSRVAEAWRQYQQYHKAREAVHKAELRLMLEERGVTEEQANELEEAWINALKEMTRGGPIDRLWKMATVVSMASKSEALVMGRGFPAFKHYNDLIMAAFYGR